MLHRLASGLRPLVAADIVKPKKIRGVPKKIRGVPKKIRGVRVARACVRPRCPPLMLMLSQLGGRRARAPRARNAAARPACAPCSCSWKGFRFQVSRHVARQTRRRPPYKCTMRSKSYKESSACVSTADVSSCRAPGRLPKQPACLHYTWCIRTRKVGRWVKASRRLVRSTGTTHFTRCQQGPAAGCVRAWPELALSPAHAARQPALIA